MTAATGRIHCVVAQALSPASLALIIIIVLPAWNGLIMKIIHAQIAILAMLVCVPLLAMTTLVPESELRFIAEELSGESAKRNLDAITLYHRTRASSQFHSAALHIRDQLQRYGLDEVTLRQYPADGETMFGTQKSRLAWEVEFAELWELERSGDQWQRNRRYASWEAMPLSVAQDSLSAEFTAALVDIGKGTEDSDYAGKNVSGKLVLTSSQPGSVVSLAMGKYHAAGILSYAPNQKSAWWKEDDRLVRWGHLGSFPETTASAFMISLKDARHLQDRLANREEIRFHAKTVATHSVGHYSLVDALIKGSDRLVGSDEIVFSCHLDHPRPGANDNASGCVTILEVARTLNRLITIGALQRPSRSIRFIWPAEIEGSLIYLNSREGTGKIKANIHMDMVGGAPVTKAVFRVSGGPFSVSSFIADLGFEVGTFVNRETEKFASGKETNFPLIAREGGKEPLLALMEGISLGSDHQVFNEGSWGIPGIYLHDWPDRYIHTNFDSAANIDPTKLMRAAFIGAVTAWYLANMDGSDVPGMLSLLRRNALQRLSVFDRRAELLTALDRFTSSRVLQQVEIMKMQSIQRYAEITENQHDEHSSFLARLNKLLGDSHAHETAPDDSVVYVRDNKIKGPMRAFGYSWLEQHLAKDIRDSLALPGYNGYWGSGGEYTYEALNLVDGKRSVLEIRNWLTAELGPVDLEIVAQYLEALAGTGLLRVKDH